MGRSRRTRLPSGSPHVGGDRSSHQEAGDADAPRLASVPSLLDDLCAFQERGIKFVDLLEVLYRALPPVRRDGVGPADHEERLRGVLAPHADRLVPRLHHLVRTNDGLLVIELAAVFLPYFGRPGAAALLDLLDHPDWAIRRAASIGVGRFGPAEAWAMRHLCEYLASHGRDPSIRRIEHGLRNMGPNEGDEIREAALALQAERHRRR